MEAIRSLNQAAHHQYTRATVDSIEHLSGPSTRGARENAGRTVDTQPRVVPPYRSQKKAYQSMWACHAQIECCMHLHPSVTCLPSTRGAGWTVLQAQHLSFDRMTIH